MRCVVIVNDEALGARGAAVEEALREAGVPAEVLRVPAAACPGAARRAAADAGVDLVVAAGGDGTVNAVAGVLAGSEKPLGVLPLGTLNHFAKDLGIPLVLADAARLLLVAAPRRVNVAEVNGRVFVNNSSVGLYPQAVRARDRLRGRLGKWPAMAWAVLRVLLRFPRIALRLRWDDGVAPRRTPFVFVGNNRYDTALLATQRRPSLSGGTLGVFVSRRQGRTGLLWLAARALVGRLDAERDLEALDVPRLTLESRRPRLQVSADGEVFRLVTPLRYRIRPGALRVVAPPAGPGEGAA